MKKVSVFLFLLLSISLAWAQDKDKEKEEEEVPKRPIANWVFTATLDGRPNVLVVALHKQLWVAYDRNNCQLIKAWQGGVKIEEGGKKVISNGLTFYQEDPSQKNGWKVMKDGETQQPMAKMGNVSLANDTLTLKYELTLSDGHVIWVEEIPEVIIRDQNPNRCGLERRIVVGNMPLNSNLGINMVYKDMLRKKDIKSDFKVNTLSHDKKIFDFGTVHDMEVDALLNPVEPTSIKMMFTVSLEKAARGK
ncbi:MAG: hypothetical protein MRZ79_01495 [Bacteroidia bacterium]|nr:hypothetical protein [Bacteroidia bacterium]